MICWMRRTGANTWRRSFPPMIIAIIIVMFDFIFFCCSIWTLIRVCVGLAIPHPSSLHLPHTVKRFNPSQPAFSWGRVWEITLPAGLPFNPSNLRLSPFHSSSSLEYRVLGFGTWYLQFFGAVELWLYPFLNPSLPRPALSRLLSLVSLGCVAAHHFSLSHLKESLNLSGGPSAFGLS